MTSSYLQIQKKIESLQLQANRLRDREVAGVVARIKVAIEHYGITADQLGLTSPKGSKSKSEASVATSSAKFSDGSGNTWGGRGPRPDWLRNELAAGKSLDQFAISPREENAKAGAKVKKRKAKVQYRDVDGRTWSGMGPRPRWLQEALAAGRAEQVSA